MTLRHPPPNRRFDTIIDLDDCDRLIRDAFAQRVGNLADQTFEVAGVRKGRPNCVWLDGTANALVGGEPNFCLYASLNTFMPGVSTPRKRCVVKTMFLMPFLLEDSTIASSSQPSPIATGRLPCVTHLLNQ